MYDFLRAKLDAAPAVRRTRRRRVRTPAGPRLLASIDRRDGWWLVRAYVDRGDEFELVDHVSLGASSSPSVRSWVEYVTLPGMRKYYAKSRREVLS
jgi:hypothetical protein